MAVKTFNPPELPSSGAPYDHISIVSVSPTAKLISIAGQIGRDFKTGTTGSTFKEQIEIALINVDKCLATAGATKKDITRVTQYIVHLNHEAPTRRELYLKYFGDLRPPSTVVGVDKLALPELLYEIEVTPVTIR